jgi:FMN reductase
VAVAAAVIEAAELTSGYQVIDLCGLARRLLLQEPSPAVEDAIEQITRADLVVVASPTFKGAGSVAGY